MLVTRIPIKYLLPLLLLAFTVSTTTAIYLTDRNALLKRVELRMEREAQERLSRIQGTLELLLELRQQTGTERQLAAFSALDDNITLLLTDSQMNVIASNRQAERGQPLATLYPQIDTATAATVIEHRKLKTLVSPDGHWVDAYASVCTRSTTSLRDADCGLLYHRLDLGYHIQNALQPLRQQTINIAISLFLAALLLATAIHLLVFRRTEKLAAAVNRYAAGERSVRSTLEGSDEIARLATIVDGMMARIESDEVEILAKEQRLNTLFDSVRDPIVVTTLNGEIRSFNRAAVALFGYQASEIVGCNINLLMPGRDRPAHVGHMTHYHAGVKKSTVIGKGRELTACNKRGEEFPVEVTITEMRNDNEVELIGVIRDITERKRAVEQMQANERRLNTLFDSVRDPIVVTSLRGTILSFNQAAEELFGYPATKVQGSNINILMPQRDHAAHDGHLSRYSAGVKSSTVIGKGRELTARKESGEEFPVEVTITEMRDGEETQLIGVIRDITERKRAEEQMLLSHQVFEAASEAIVITDANSIIIDVNPAYEAITGYSRTEMIGQRPSKVSSHRHDETFYQAMWQRIRETGNWAGEIWDRRKNGEAYPKWLTINAIRNAQGEVVHYVGIFSDITEQKAAEQQLEQLAYYDPLTKLPNRSLFRERLQRELLLCQRSGQHAALLFIDLDRFKQVNDTLGHDVGDDLLVAVAQRLNSCVRGSDTVCRLGGDEFTVILSNIAGREGITKVAQSIIEQLQQTFLLHGHQVQIGGSVGIAQLPEDAADFIEANKKADIAMYHAKSAGRGNYQFYSDTLK